LKGSQKGDKHPICHFDPVGFADSRRGFLKETEGRNLEIGKDFSSLYSSK
jgi:hypothetical protein